MEFIKKIVLNEVIRTLVHSLRDVEACLRVEQEFQQKITWRISPRPFQIDRNTYAEIESLGALLLEFYRCIQELYFGSASGRLPRWIGEYLELGKPEQVIEYGRMRRFRRDVPLIIRPDILLTEDGLAITELDSVPGGFPHWNRDGTFERLRRIGGPDGIVQGFAQVRGMVEEEPV